MELRLRHYINRIYDIEIKPNLSGEAIQKKPDGQRTNQQQDKIPFGDLDDHQSKPSPKENSIQIPTPSTLIDYCNYLKTSKCPNEIPITAVERFFGQNKKTMKHQKIPGRNWYALIKTVNFKTSNKKTYL